MFGFYRNQKLVGYAQAAYFPEESLYFIEYLTIDERHRGNNVFFEMVEHVKNFLEDAHPDYRYGVTEVMNEPGQDHPSEAKTPYPLTEVRRVSRNTCSLLSTAAYDE